MADAAHEAECGEVAKLYAGGPLGQQDPVLTPTV